MSRGARLRKACEEAGIGLRTYRRYKDHPEAEDGRKGPKTEPKNKLSVEERDEVVRVVTCPEFRDLSVAQVVPRLADRGEYVASESTMRRVLKERGLAGRRGNVRPPTQRRPAAFVADGPRQVWVWDITYLRASVRGSFYYLYLFVDLFSRKVVGWAVEDHQSDKLAAELLSRIHQTEGRPTKLVVHADNGSPQTGSTMLATMQSLGIAKSFSRPRVSDDNAYAEAMFRLLKYVPWYPSRPFHDIDEARDWVRRFVAWYNDEHRHGALRFVTPSERHSGRDVEVLAKRHELYQQARERRPDRWTTRTRNWSRPGPVHLNPVRLQPVPDFITTSSA